MRNSVYDPQDFSPDSTLSVLGKKSFSMQCGKLIQQYAPSLRLQDRPNSQHLLNDLNNGGLALFPFQNYSSMEVDEYLELLRDTPNIHVVGDAILEVRMDAIGTVNCDLERVQQVNSHPQGLRQSTKFVRGLPALKKQVLTNSTDEAVTSIGDSDETIALASRDAIGEDSPYRVVKDGVSNQELQGKQNATHFLEVAGGGKRILQADRSRQLWLITPPDYPGVMAKITDIIAKNGGNLYVLLSRPIGLEEHTFVVGITAANGHADYEKMYADINAIPSSEDGLKVIEPLGGWNTHVRDPRLNSNLKPSPVIS